MNALRSTRSLILAIWLVIAAVAVYLLGALYVGHREQDEAARQRTGELTRLIAEHAAARFQQANLVLLSALDAVSPQDFSNARELTEARRKELQEHLKTIQARSPGIVSMSVTDADGVVFANTVGTPPGVRLGDRPYFLELKHGARHEPVVSELIFGRVSRKWGVQLARRANFADGRFAGMIVANLGIAETFGNFYQSMRLEPESIIMLRNDTNQILVRSPPSESHTGKVVSGTAATEAMLRGIDEAVLVAVSPVDRVERFLGLRRIPDYPVYASVGLSTGVVFASWRQQAAITLLMLFGASLGGIMLSHALRRRDSIARMLERSNDELLRSSARVQNLFAQASDAIVIMRGANAIDCNKAAEKLYRCGRDDIIGRQPIDFSPPQQPDGSDSGSALRQLVSRAETGEAVFFEWRNRRADGTPVDVEVSLSRIDGGDDPLLQAIIRDITERKEAENASREHQARLEAMVNERTAALSAAKEAAEAAKEAAEAASRSKSSFLANMSHELRTPMNAIIGMTELARRRASDPKQQEQLAKVAQASEHLLEVINDILDISKIEADRLVIEQIEFRLADVFQRLGNLTELRAAEKELHLSFVLPPELGARSLLGDPLRLGQILLNLVANAIKFTPQGSVTVSATLIDADDTTASVRFSVRDTGIGIDAADQERLFTAFEQADGSMTRRYGGTGLGLAISKRLAECMGGGIGAESNDDGGSTFWFTARFGISSGRPRAALPDESVFRAGAFTGQRVLLVEDEPINQEVARELLEELGLTVDIAGDGISAARQALAGDYALILMDIQMPGQNGLDATRQIRAADNDTPIIAMTASAFDENRDRCIAAGMNDHLSKPVDPDVLFGTLNRWLNAPPAH